MPSGPTYPGIYIEEISSGVRTITGVSTSIAAFLGRGPRGAVDAPTVLSSWADFERLFGGLDRAYPLSYAVRDFYLNGGREAVVVRLYKADGQKASTAAVVANGLSLKAASAGSWGNDLQVRIDAKVSADAASGLGLTTADLFDLTVRDSVTGTVEKFVNLTIKDSSNRVDAVLENQSSLLRVQSSAWPPANVPAPHADPPAGKDIWDPGNNPATFSAVNTTDKARDGLPLTVAADYIGEANAKTGMYALEKIDLFNLLCIPEDTLRGGVPAGLYHSDPLAYCVRRRALLIMDPPPTWTKASVIIANNNQELTGLGVTGEAARNAALFFPRIVQADPNLNGRQETFVPCGAVAGMMARTDRQRGVWNAPAGIEASLNGLQGLSVPLTDTESALLNPLGVNCLRTFPIYGSVVWGSRTMRGANIAADEYKYIPVRRTALFLEESLFRGTKWVVFEPNGEPLWAQIRLNIEAFMQGLFRQGAFQGKTPREAYFVKCDKETTTQNDINSGLVNILVGFAPLNPAEFVLIKIEQRTGQIAT